MNEKNNLNFDISNDLIKSEESLKEKMAKEAKQLEREANEKRKKNISDALLVLFGLALTSLILYAIEIIRLPDGFKWYNSQSDGFLLFVSLIAIVGAIWAVLARIDAERAFKQAEFARIKSEEATLYSYRAYEQSIQTYKSVADAFEFDKILDEMKLPFYIDQIGESDTDVTLFLGFPCVGFFYDGDQFKEKSLETFKKLADKIMSLAKQTERIDRKFTFHIACFSKRFTESYIDKMVSEKKLNSDYANRLRDEIEKFYPAVETLNDKYQHVDICLYTRDMGMRFTVYSKNPPKTSKYDSPLKINSMVWVVADFDQKSAEEFQSAGFKTEDINFSTTLRALFKNMKKLNTQIQE